MRFGVMNKMVMRFSCLPLVLCLVPLSVFSDVAPVDFRERQSDAVWEEKVRKPVFQDRVIIEGEGQAVLHIKAPHAAEDAALVPISIHALIPQDPAYYIRQIAVFVDKNPVPLVGYFDLTLNSGKADLAMRIRVDDFSYVRAIAETSDGKLHMVKHFVRAKGACSAPPPTSIADSKKMLGKIQMKLIGEVDYGEPSLMQIRIRHPNITGLAPIEIGSRVRPPAFFVRELEVDFEDVTIMKATLTFAISMDPVFRFFFIPDRKGYVTVKGLDTKNNHFQSRYAVQQDTG